MNMQKLNTGLGLNLSPRSQAIVKGAVQGAAIGVAVNAVMLAAVVAVTLATRK